MTAPLFLLGRPNKIESTPMTQGKIRGTLHAPSTSELLDFYKKGKIVTLMSPKNDTFAIIAFKTDITAYGLKRTLRLLRADYNAIVENSNQCREFSRVPLAATDGEWSIEAVQNGRNMVFHHQDENIITISDRKNDVFIERRRGERSDRAHFDALNWSKEDLKTWRVRPEIVSRVSGMRGSIFHELYSEKIPMDDGI